jgi:hypothetical protein
VGSNGGADLLLIIVGMKPFGDGAAGELPRCDKVEECGWNVCARCERDGGKEVGRAVLRNLEVCLRGATDGVIGPVVSVTITSSGLRAGDSTLSPRARVGNGARVARPSWQPVQSLVGFSVASLLSSVARVVGCARSMSRKASAPA